MQQIGLTADLLPVVSNLRANISPKSTLKMLGKVPSLYNRTGNAVGIKGWINHATTDKDIARWMRNHDLGICIKTGQSTNICAFDIDISDPHVAQRIEDGIAAAVGQLPVRFRSNSGKRLLMFRMPGRFDKRVIHTAQGLIEFLATGQQFIAVGMHTSGVRYEWRGGLPQDIPELAPAEFAGVWKALQETYGIEPESVAHNGPMRPAIPRAASSTQDDVAAFLVGDGWAKSETNDGRLNIRCPFEADHTTDSGETSTQYFPAGVGGFERGHFKCQHAHCMGRKDHDFIEAIGLMAGEFDVLPDPTPEQQALGEQIQARNQAKKLAARARLSAPSAAEISRAIDTNVANQVDPGEIAKQAIRSLADGQVSAVEQAQILQKLKSVTGVNLGALKSDLLVATLAASHPAAAGVSISDPVSSARALMERDFMRSGHIEIRRWQNVFYVWNGQHYVAVSEEDVRAWIYKLFRTQGVGLATKAPVDNTLDALRAQANVGSNATMPGWLCKSPPAPATEIIPVRNGLLHLPSRSLLNADARFFTGGSVDVEFDPAASRPEQWLKFLDDVFQGDQESISALQQWFGLLLTSDTSHQKALILVGPKRSGKGTIGRVLRTLLGDSNYCGPNLNQLGRDFGLQSLIGKNLALISDARLSGRADQQRIAEVMLNVTGEDAINVQRKNLTDWVGKLPTRFVMLTNVLPGIIDSGSAVASRFIVLKINQSFYGREDPQLLGKLLQELPGILNWALDGLAALQGKGHLSQPVGGQEAVAELKRRTTPLVGFIEDVLVFDSTEDAWVSKDDLYDAYRNWCNREGMTYTAAKSTFLGELYVASDQRLSPYRPHDKTGLRVNAVKGARIRFSTASELPTAAGANAKDIE